MNDPRHDAAGPGIADAELIRYLDGELDPRGRHGLERRLADDPAAARRLQTLRRRGRRMRDLLAGADATVLGNGRSPAIPEAGAVSVGADSSRPPNVVPLHGGERGRRRSAAPARRSLRRAAVVVLALAAAAVLVPPVRALIADGLGRLAAALGGEPAVSSAPAPAASSAPAPGTAVDGSAGLPDGQFGAAFDVATADFRIEIASAQTAGTLTVRPGAGGRGSASVEGPESATELLFSDGILRIRNAEDATASYVIALPATVRQVYVRVAGGDLVTLRLDRERRIELARR